MFSYVGTYVCTYVPKPVCMHVGVHTKWNSGNCLNDALNRYHHTLRSWIEDRRLTAMLLEYAMVRTWADQSPDM